MAARAWEGLSLLFTLTFRTLHRSPERNTEILCCAQDDGGGGEDDVLAKDDGQCAKPGG